MEPHVTLCSSRRESAPCCATGLAAGRQSVWPVVSSRWVTYPFSDFPLSIFHFPFAILMRHNVRHSIFNLMAINHARQKFSSLSPSSYPTTRITLSLSNVFLGFSAECCHIFLWLEAGRRRMRGWASSFRISLALELLQWVYYAAATLANPTHWHITCQRIFFNKLGKTYTPTTPLTPQHIEYPA